jgi:rhodanese-related sulfurtransferase
MAQFIEFVGNHTFLFFSFMFITGLLIWNLIEGQISGIQAILPQEATLLINHEDALILDVREEKEFVDGHILNAMHIPLSALSGKISRLEKYKDRPIIANCASGNRSGNACKILKKSGFDKIYNLKGGIIAWNNASLPVMRGKK